MVGQTFAAPLEVDREALLELARGGNLYQDRFACVRELLQNATDATLLRLFVDRGADAFPTYEGSMRDLRAALTAYPIDVSIERLEDDTAGPEPARRYRVVIEDRGLGISREDLPHLQRIGSSQKNPRRAALIASMPEWMRPSGTFGIGLQSAFLVSDTLVLDTRTPEGGAHTITLRASDGGTLDVHASDRATVGTRAEWVVRVDTSAVAQNVFAQTLGDPRDIVLEVSSDPLLQAARDTAVACAGNSLTRVRVDGSDVARATDEAARWFDVETLLEIALPSRDDDGVVDPVSPTHDYGWREFQDRLTYRGARIDVEGLNQILGVRVTTDLHFGTARGVLLVGRDTLSFDGATELRVRLARALQRHVERWLSEPAPDRPRLRAWLSAHAKARDWPSAGDAWRDLLLTTRADGRTLTLGEAVTLGELTDSGEQGGPLRLYELPDGTLAQAITDPVRSRLLSAFFRGLRLDERKHTLTRAPGWFVSESGLRQQLERVWPHVARNILFVPEALRVLAVPDEAASAVADLFGYEPAARDAMVISPWVARHNVVTVPNAPAWIRWTARPRSGHRRNEEAVARALATLLRLGDATMRSNAKLRVVYDLDAVLAEIEAAYPGATSTDDEDGETLRRAGKEDDASE